jgi:hypothetical protein
LKAFKIFFQKGVRSGNSGWMNDERGTNNMHNINGLVGVQKVAFGKI